MVFYRRSFVKKAILQWTILVCLFVYWGHLAFKREEPAYLKKHLRYCEYQGNSHAPGVGIEPGSLRWEACVQTTVLTRTEDNATVAVFFFYHFGNRSGAIRIGKNQVVLTKIGKLVLFFLLTNTLKLRINMFSTSYLLRFNFKSWIRTWTKCDELIFLKPSILNF